MKIEVRVVSANDFAITRDIDLRVGDELALEVDMRDTVGLGISAGVVRVIRRGKVRRFFRRLAIGSLRW